MTRKYTNNRMQEKLKNFGEKVVNQNNIKKCRIDKQHGERVRRIRRRIESENVHSFTKNDTKKCQIEKRLAMME